jgi:hypothetical protein
MRITIEIDEQGQLTVTPASASQPVEAGSEAGAPAHLRASPEEIQHDETVVLNGGSAPSHAAIRSRALHSMPSAAIDAGEPPAHLLEAEKAATRLDVSNGEPGSATKAGKPPKHTR